MIRTILITNDPQLAAEAEAAGVTRIMVDLETMGKKERQASRQTFISKHRMEDIAVIRKAVRMSKLLVRINPWHEGSRAEIKDVVKAGADIIMLPMITEMAQLDAFLAALNGRVMPLPLLETRFSLERIDDIAAKNDIKEVYIGLNDLHLSLNLKFLFEPLALGYLDTMAKAIQAHGKAFGFGGIGALGGGGELPPERILGEHVRLGSSCVILSSRFVRDTKLDDPRGRATRLQHALRTLQQAHERLAKRTKMQVEDDTRYTCGLIKKLAEGQQ